MARWDPDARLRLVDAAAALFSEQGYDTTSVAQIAERAGLTKSTFFRHFADKREVLFAGQEAMSTTLATAIIAAPPDATPLEAIARALTAIADFFPPERRSFGIRLRAVVAAHSDLQEREALKGAGMAAAVDRALRDRGVSDPAASVAAQLAVMAFHVAFVRWADASNEQPFGEVAQQALQELHAASSTLT